MVLLKTMEFTRVTAIFRWDVTVVFASLEDEYDDVVYSWVKNQPRFI